MSETALQNIEIKEMYEDKISSTYKDNYEFNRWFINARLRLDYAMTYRSIQHHLEQTDFSTCLELGPGPGTWTRLLYRCNPEAAFDLIDISQAMADQFKLEMRESSNVSYRVGDFLQHTSEKKYDLFFSSRAVEYFEDVDKLFDKIDESLAPGGTGILVTKNPDHFSIGKLLNRYTERKHHTGQISRMRMDDLITSHSFTDVKIFPCIIRLPLLDRLFPKLAENLFASSYKQSTNKLPLFAESYVVTFKKPT